MIVLRCGPDPDVAKSAICAECGNRSGIVANRFSLGIHMHGFGKKHTHLLWMMHSYFPANN